MEDKTLVMIRRQELDDIKQCVEDLINILGSVSRELKEFNELVEGKRHEAEENGEEG